MRQVYSQNKFGYMWECPNIVQIDGKDFLAVCPQGLEHEAEPDQEKPRAVFCQPSVVRPPEFVLCNHEQVIHVGGIVSQSEANHEAQE